MLGRDGELHQLGPRIHEQIDQGKMALGGRIDLVRPGVNAVQLSSGTAVLPYLTLRTTAVPVGVVPLQPAVVHVTVADASKAMWCNDRCRCRRPDLGDFGYAYAASYGVSGDGSVVVGEAWNASFEQRAFRWTVAGGLQDLGTLGGPYARAADVSADGQMIVGDSWDASGNNHAFRWTATSGMQDLGTFGGFDSGAYGVSADGSVVVGMAYPKAFRWTVTNGMEPIGTSGSPSQAFSVSQDGSVIVGRSTKMDSTS